MFVSVVESYSHDRTAQHLRDLKAQLDVLGVENQFLLENTSIDHPPSMDTAPPRIEFLSSTRNLALMPLVERGNFDRVVFSNDVFIEAESIIELLATKNGDWDMVCGIDLARWGYVFVAGFVIPLNTWVGSMMLGLPEMETEISFHRYGLICLMMRGSKRFETKNLLRSFHVGTA